MPDFIPAPDPAFNTFMLGHVPYIQTNAVALGLTVPQGNALASLLNTWSNGYSAHTAAQSAAAAALESKETYRENLEQGFREAAAIIQAKPEVTNAQRELAGVPVHDTIRTPTAEIPTRPVIMVDTSERLRHTIKWVDELTPTSRARPAAAMGLELYCKVGAPAPVSAEGCTALGLVTNSPNVEEYDAAQANQTVYYLGRWVNKRGRRGPLSVVVNATISG